MMSKTAAEPLVRISKREGTTFVQKVLVRAIAILLALVVDAFFIFFVTGLNPISVYGVMWNGTFMNTTRFSWALRDLSSLLCIAIALAPAFKMRFWNIGGEGQVLIGGLVAALIMVYFGSSLPAPLLFAAMVIGSVLAGAIWAFVPAWFKSRWNTNETLFTLMMNYVAIQLTSYFVALWENPVGSNTVGVINQRTKDGWFPELFGQEYGLNVVLVLLLTSRSYAEIPVLLLTFIAAALLNLGTNFIFGEISFVSNSVTVVLQLALAIDYAIIMLHRFLEEREHAGDREACTAAASAAPVPS